MYIPMAFREDRLDRLHEVIRQQSFAILVSNGEDGPIATHLPLLLDPTRGPLGTLVGHVARENPQWRAFDAEQDTLAVFSGPHAYISPSWYQTLDAVPTWNYIAVHAYGRPRLIEDQAALYDLVARLVARYEQPFAAPWDLANHRDYAETLLEHIVGFEMEIGRLEGAHKLSRNRSRADQEGVIHGLTGQGDPLALAVAAGMQQHLT